MLDGIGANIERYMDLVSFRQKLVAGNIANADTPGYTTKDVDFQAELQSAMGVRNASVVEKTDLPVKSDGNNVSIEREARLLSENAMRFSVASQFARGALNAVRTAIQGGRNS